ncbi:MAG: PIN domain nuclease [Hahellaceae bacterium]|nr:PIN domain nuclease [Hahellaceae bacterium]MCP5169094.1 PIN domain nuclease [Hahellaceae bacterium]
MIIVDSSVWIDYFNGNETFESDILDNLLGTQEVATGDLIMLEVLRGFRSDKDYKTAKDHLTTLVQYNMLNSELAIKATDFYRKLRKKGITVRKTADVIIATFCIENNHSLLYSDRDFTPFVEHLGLRSVATRT